jgi:hypothetical protein
MLITSRALQAASVTQLSAVAMRCKHGVFALHCAHARIVDSYTFLTALLLWLDRCGLCFLIAIAMVLNKKQKKMLRIFKKITVNCLQIEQR